MTTDTYHYTEHLDDEMTYSPPAFDRDDLFARLSLSGHPGIAFPGFFDTDLDDEVLRYTVFDLEGLSDDD